MSTIQTISSSEAIVATSIPKINTNFSNLNTDKAELSGATFTGDINVPDEAYNATTWNGSTEVPTKNALRDKIESLPVLSDGDKGDITLSSSGTVWTIDNDVVTNAKMANMATQTFKGRTTAGTGDPEDLTATQATALLNEATTSLKGLLSASDKTKLDGLANEWTLDKSGTLTASATYNSGTLSSYDMYRVDIVATSTSGATTTIGMRFNSDSGASAYSTLMRSTTGGSSTPTGSEFSILSHTQGSGAVFTASYIVDKQSGTFYGNFTHPFINGSTTATGAIMGSRGILPTSIQLIMGTISGTVKIYGRNY